MLLILLAASALRIHNIDFGLPSLWDDDEPFFLMFGLKLLKNQTLNPGWFGHPGTTTIYLISLCTGFVYAAGSLFGSWSSTAEFVAAIYARPELIMVPQRMMIAIPGLISVWLTWRIGQRIHSATAGLIAAAILALSPLHIELSQLVRTDVQMTMCVIWSVYAALPLSEGYQRRALVLSSVLAGAACATKWPGALILLVALSFVATGEGSRYQKALRSALAIFSCAGALLAISPYLLLDYRTVLANVLVEGRPRHLSQTSGSLLETLAHYGLDVLPDALGWPALLLACFGLVLMAISPRRSALAIPVGVPVVTFLGLISLQSIMWPRWAVPMLPFLALAAGISVAALAERLAGLNKFAKAAASISGLLIIFLPLAVGASNAAAERSIDTRDLALKWIEGNVQAAASIAVETPALALLRGPWPLRFPLGDAGCVDPRRAMAGHVDYDDVARATRNRININLSTVSAVKLQSCRADFVVVNEYDRYLAEARYYPSELANYRVLLAGMKQVAIFAPERGKAGGPVVRIYENVDKRAAKQRSRAVER